MRTRWRKWGNPNSRIKAFAFIEILLIAVFLLSVICYGKNLKKSVPVQMEEWESGIAAFQDGDWHIDSTFVEGLDMPDEGIPIFYHNEMSLKKGSYTLTIKYSSEEDQYFLPFADNGNDHFIKAEKAVLYKNQKIEKYRFYTTENLKNFQIRFLYNGSGNFEIKNVSLAVNDLGLKRGFLYFLSILLIADTIIFIIFASKEKRKSAILIFAITFFVSLPLFIAGLNNNGGQDLLYHLARIEALTASLRKGDFPVRLASSWFCGYGYPSSIYYGDATLYFPALLRLLGLSIYQTYKVYVFSVNFITVLISYLCFKKIYNNSDIGLLLALLYTVAPYRLYDIYHRAAVGEYTVFIFYPLIVLGLFLIYSNENKKVKKNILYSLPLASGMSGIIITHVLSAEIALFFLIITVLIFGKKTFRLNSLRSFAFSAGFSLIFSMGFLVPFLDYQDQEIKGKYFLNSDIPNQIQDYGVNTAEYFTFFKNPISNFKGIYSPGIILMFGLILAIILIFKKKAAYEIKCLSILSVIILFFATDLFPWNHLSYHYGFFNFLSAMQFPWRIVSVSIPVLTVLAGFVIENEYFEELVKIKKHSALVIFAIITVLCTCYFASQYDEYAVEDRFYDTYDIDVFEIKNGEYLRTSDKYGNTDVNAFDGEIVGDNVFDISNIHRKDKHIEFSCKTGEKNGNVIMPLINYKYYRAADKDGNVLKIINGENNLVSIRVPSRYHGKITVEYRPPVIWNVTFIISVFSILFVLSGLLTRIVKRGHRYEKQAKKVS